MLHRTGNSNHNEEVEEEDWERNGHTRASKNSPPLLFWMCFEAILWDQFLKKGQFVDGLWGYKLSCEHFIKLK